MASIESYGSWELITNDDGTFSAQATGSNSPTVIKDYGGSPYRGGDIVAVENFNGSTAVLFSGGHVWYVDGSWTKAPVGPGGKDTENLAPSEIPTYFFSDSPPPTYDDGALADPIPAPVPVPDPVPEPVPDPDPMPVLPPPPEESSSGVELESFGAYSLYQMNDGTFRVNSEFGEQIKDYGGSPYRGGDIVAVDDFNGSRAVLFGSGHVWYVDASWTKAPTGPNGEDTTNLQPNEFPTYFFTNSPPPTYDDGATEPLPLPDPDPLPIVPPPPEESSTGVELESFGAYSLYQMNDGTFRVNSESGEQIKDYGGSAYRGGDIVAVDDFNGSRAVLFGSGHVWYVDASWTKAPTGPNGEDTTNLQPNEFPTYFFTNNPPPTYDEGATPPLPPVSNPGDDGTLSEKGDELESFGAFSLFRMTDNTFRVGSLDGPLVRDYGGSIYRGGDIVAADNFNGGKAVLFNGGHVWYVDDNWTKAPVGPNGRDTENLSARDMVVYFSSDSPPATYESGQDPDNAVPPVAPPPTDNDLPATSGFELESFGSYSLFRMDDNTFRIGSTTGPRVRDYGGSVYRGGDVVAVDSFNGSAKAVLFGSGHLWYVDDNWTKAPLGPDGRDTENLSTVDMATYFYSDNPPVIYAPVEDEIPRIPPAGGLPGEEQEFSTEGFMVEGSGNYPLYSMMDGTYRVGTLDGELIKDYGGTIWRGGAIIAADDFNGARAVVFEGGHVWYVNDSWTKAPVGPNGRDTEQLSFREINDYFYSGNPPADFGNPVFDQPVERPDEQEYSTNGKIAEGFGDWPLYKMDDGTYRVGSLDGALIKDYGGTVWQGGTIVAADKFNGALAVVFEGGHLWYVNSNWTKAQVGPRGRDTENLTTLQLANYFYNDTPPLFFDDEEFETAPPGTDLPDQGRNPDSSGTVIEDFGTYSLYRMNDGTYRVNSLDGELLKDAGGQVWTGGGVVAVDDIKGIRTVAFADGNIWYADASWTKANVGPEGKSADAFTAEEISDLFFDGRASAAPEDPDELTPPSDVISPPEGLDPAEFNFLYSSPTGKELVNRLIAVGIERILANISLEQIDLIFAKFGDDVDFLEFAETPDKPQIEFESEMWTVSLLPSGVYEVEPTGGGSSAVIRNANGSPTLDSVVAVTTSNFVNMVAFEGGRVWYVDSNWQKAPLGPNGTSAATFSASDIDSVFFGGTELNEKPNLEVPVEGEEGDVPDTPPGEENPETPVDEPPEDLPPEEGESEEGLVEPGGGLPEEEFLFFFDSETGLEIVTKIQAADLDRLSFLISDEQAAQIFAKFSEDPDWQAFIDSIQGSDRTASELTIGQDSAPIYEIELVGNTFELYPDYGLSV